MSAQMKLAPTPEQRVQVCQQELERLLLRYGCKLVVVRQAVAANDEGGSFIEGTRYVVSLQAHNAWAEETAAAPAQSNGETHEKH